ncbi:MULTISPECIES: cag pathogenicity island Cag12 family protein [Campylobacter]|uniref:Cag pathogenicity island protein n=2 Tax=Campylobacter TaxID=194 RepID=A0AAX2UL41_9BACT|nr:MULTISPECIES: cag pathogenicity island Cag12 family protein [Campylobacter]EEY3086003.1 cag pathogenicity island protein [Campylobacter jejuni]ARE81482.1 Cag12 family protein [Campylobacter helveticus]EAI3917898.1 cag pathogenicity island protein [Campylobacter upsaliensis]EAI4345269.1 cag pathogenicity island protein [Campylobacter upsaliensis]EAI8173310.1 cag pathogenicity island protein [Campylobacter upsaliensis]
MKNIKLSLALASVILLAGCGAKSPAKLQNSKNLGINNALLEQKYSFIPKDEFLSHTNFVYELELIPSGEYLIANELMVKTFLLAHNASKIIIVGDEDKIKAYKNYFLENGVRADMYLQPLDDYQNDSVKLLFFNKK